VKTLTKNIASGIGIGLFIATGFTAWVTLLRLTVGTEPFERNDTTYEDVVQVYYAGGLLGGLFVGLLWPLHRWVLGSAVLGIVGMFPMYYGFAIQHSPSSEWLSADKLVTGLALSIIVGSAVGTGVWLSEHPHGPRWVDALRYPTPRTVGRVWLLALASAAVAWFLGLKWAGQWPAIVAIALWLVPMGFAVGVSVVAVRRNSANRRQ
jgi:hypothetical protein